MAQTTELSAEGNSPRSTVLPSPDRMTSPEGGGSANGAKSDPSKASEPGDSSNVNHEYNEQEGEVTQQKDTKEPESPNGSQTYPHLTPQPQVAGYPPYPSQVTPASPSPATNAVFTDAYGASFLGRQSVGAFMPHSNPFGGHPSPLSPPRPTTAAGATMTANGVPPNSPLFPRLGGAQSTLHPNGFDRVMQQPPSPTLAAAYSSGGYQNYAGASALQQSGSTDESQVTPGGWMDAGYVESATVTPYNQLILNYLVLTELILFEFWQNGFKPVRAKFSPVECSGHAHVCHAHGSSKRWCQGCFLRRRIHVASLGP